MIKYEKKFFRTMLREQLKCWIAENKSKLVGSAIFTKGRSFTANIVTWAEGWRCLDKKAFRPSHTGSIIEKDGQLFIFDMKPPRAALQPLEKYLWMSREDFVLILRDFDLDSKMFSSNLLYQEGRGYPYMSAIRSVFTKRQTKWNCHCSELHLRELQKQGLYLDVNPEITPDELLHLMEGGYAL